MTEVFRATPACRTVTDMLGRIGDKWSILIINYLGNKPMRFNELRRTIDGISQKMLTSTLRTLERDGYVLRTAFPTIPPRVEYELTELGRDLLVPVRALGDWAVANEAHVSKARKQFDDRNGLELLGAAELADADYSNVNRELSDLII